MDDMGNSGQNGPLGVQISSNSDILKKNCESRHEERCLIDYNDEMCMYKSTDTAKASSETVNILSNCKKEKPGKYQNYTRYGQEALGERDIKIMNVCPVLETHKKSRVCDEEAKIISHSDQSEIEIAINSPLDTENTGLGDWGCNGDLAIVSNSGRNADISQMEGTLLPSVAVVSSSTNTPQVEVSDLGKKTGKNSTLLFVGLKTSIAVALHKFPEGVILYLSSTSSHRIGLWVASSLFVHNFPEGLMLALPLFLSTKSKSRTLAIALVMGAVPPVLGALFGAWMARATDATGVDGINHSENRGLVQNMMFGLTFAVASGMMLAVSITGMLPAAKMYDPTNKFVTTISFLVSVLFSHFVGNVIFAD
ncbi:Zinc transporter ZupT [Zancudomyces culisetae]|uniref:Zinc transporter ZupT n=1 Tax=Zancudomyces culisetae TaxID=1213189 RepID=A0A1R1PYX9_ZANCU|nr:Zinc transporter ZupT [Zancudomyces culisetae]|eukprot:OMH86134.1 Zinc transporter ZupT [Zancudomyces culisetae]